VSATIGVELGPDLIRAVRREGWGGTRVLTFEQHWDPDEPGEAIAALRKNLGKIGRLAVTVDLSFLFAKQVRLPALPTPEKRRVLSLEPERFFPVRGEDLVLAVRGQDNLVFAMRATLLEPWLEALETIAPVELVEPSPVSLARALGRSDPRVSTILTEEKGEGVGIVEVGGGRVRRIRRIQSDPAELSAAVAATVEAGPVYLRPLNGKRGWLPSAAVEMEKAGELPAVAGVPASHLAAYGAALGLGGDLGEALLPVDISRQIIGRRRRTVAIAALACTLALVFAMFSLDAFRSRTLGKLDAEIARVREQGEEALALERQADALSRETRTVASLDASRIDFVGALAALTRRLPTGAHLQALRSTGADWQIDGYTREAAPLVSVLDEDRRFKDVHFLTATSRVPLGGKTYESFSIALRLVPAP
jgi:hypothetical protein